MTRVRFFKRLRSNQFSAQNQDCAPLQRAETKPRATLCTISAFFVFVKLVRRTKRKAQMTHDCNIFSLRANQAPPAGIGHNSREDKAAAPYVLLSTPELRARYVASVLARKKLPAAMRALFLAAACERLGLAELRVLLIEAAHGDPDGENIWASNRTVAAIANLSERSVERAHTVVKDGGWMVMRRRRRENAVRAVVIPKNLSAALKLELGVLAAFGVDLTVLAPYLDPTQLSVLVD